MTLPITLTYSSSGRKVSDVTGAVGLGWNLNIGGMVSRTIYGSPDESYSFPSDLKYASEYNLRSYPDYDFLATLVHFDRSSTDYSSYLDTEYDVFSYLVGSHSGHFVLDNYHPVMLNSASPLRINSATVSNVSITDENGVTYLFNKPAYSTTVFKGSIGQLTDFVTGANLTKMTSCDGKYAINLSYSTYEYNQAPSTYNYLSITDCTLDDYFYDYPYGCSSVKSQYDRVIMPLLYIPFIK